MSTTLIERGVPFADWRARLQQRLHAARSHDGFSLLELVVAVSIMLILAVVGFIAYQGLTDNAREAAVESAAHDVYVGAQAEWHNPGATDLQGVADGYNQSADGITTTVVPAADAVSDICVHAVMDDHPQFEATRGDCEGVDVPGNGEDNDNNGSASFADEAFAVSPVNLTTVDQGPMGVTRVNVEVPWTPLHWDEGRENGDVEYDITWYSEVLQIEGSDTVNGHDIESGGYAFDIAPPERSDLTGAHNFELTIEVTPRLVSTGEIGQTDSTSFVGTVFYNSMLGNWFESLLTTTA